MMTKGEKVYKGNSNLVLWQYINTFKKITSKGIGVKDFNYYSVLPLVNYLIAQTPRILTGNSFYKMIS